MQAQLHTLKNLFDQLGLASGERAIEEFIAAHKLSASESIASADFWTESQRQFIEESWQDDSDWCESIDHLDALLRVEYTIH